MIPTLLTALMACMPRYHDLPAMEPDALYTPLPYRHTTVQVDDQSIDIAYVDEGRGDPIVFVHGLSSYVGFWEYQLPEFTDTHRVIALDLPGYGASARPDAPYTPPFYADVVAGLLDALSIDRATIVGHSMGGQTALSLALDHPDRVDALILSAPAGIERFKPGHARWMKDFWTEDRALNTPEVEVRAAFTQAVFNNRDDGVERLIEERVRLGKSPAFRGTSVAVARSIAGMVDHPVADRLGEIGAPTLLVFGTDDRMIPNPVFNGGRTRTIAEQGRDAIPNAELVMIPRAGHTVHHDAPELFNKAMSAFLARQSGGSSSLWDGASGELPMIVLLASIALATPGFEPADGVRLTGDETFTQDGSLKLWSAIERHEDPDRTLFVAEEFNSATAWVNADYAPHIAESFGTPTPHSSSFLLHMGLNEEVATGTPILMVPGAGDNGSRGFITLATKLDRLVRPVYVLTFAHPHGDVMMQAETVANAISVIKERTGAAQVDLVSHSKGGIASAVYLSHTDDAVWPEPAYENVGTPYRDDVRRAVFVATPLDGIDTAFRWPSINYLGLDPDQALAPTSWERYYPYGTASPLVYDDLTEQDFLPGGGDLFPGQRQLLRRQDPPLPGSLSWLGPYALQTDWYTTYEGGLGFTSSSDGIDAAVTAGGHLLDHLEAQGVDPDVELYLLAGDNPLMPNGDAALFEGAGDNAQWAALLATWQNNGVNISADSDELQGLEDGHLVVGEVTGDSDGLVFTSSALHGDTLTGRGAVVVEQKTADLSHLDLLYASPVTGQLLVDAGEADPESDAWMRSVGRRYTDADTLGWMVEVLADPDQPDTEDPQDPDDSNPEDVDGRDAGPRPCGSCDAGGAGGMGFLAMLIPLWMTRRRAS